MDAVAAEQGMRTPLDRVFGLLSLLAAVGKYERCVYPDQPAGFVYFAKGKGPEVKIGWSENPDRRAKSLSSTTGISSGGGDVRILARLAATSPSAERALHERFAANRRRGEWFIVTDELARVIRDAREGRRPPEVGPEPSATPPPEWIPPPMFFPDDPKAYETYDECAYSVFEAERRQELFGVLAGLIEAAVENGEDGGDLPEMIRAYSEREVAYARHAEASGWRVRVPAAILVGSMELFAFAWAGLWRAEQGSGVSAYMAWNAFQVMIERWRSLEEFRAWLALERA